MSNNTTREETIFATGINTDMAWEVTGQTVDEFGNAEPVTGFLESDTLEVKVWGGAGTAAVFTPTATWIDAPGGVVRLDVTAAQTAALTVGAYPLDLNVIVGSERRPFLRAWFEVLEAPGLEEALPTYGTVQDLYDYGGGAWLGPLRFLPGLANFARQRSQARSRLDTLVLKAWRPWTVRNGARDAYLDSGASQSLEGYDPTLRGYLADGMLMVTDMTREICALMALEIICRSQMTLAGDDPWPARAAYFRAMAGNRIKCYRAEVDTNADGIGDQTFNLGVHSIR